MNWHSGHENSDWWSIVCEWFTVMQASLCLTPHPLPTLWGGKTLWQTEKEGEKERNLMLEFKHKQSRPPDLWKSGFQHLPCLLTKTRWRAADPLLVLLATEVMVGGAHDWHLILKQAWHWIVFTSRNLIQVIKRLTITVLFLVCMLFSKDIQWLILFSDSGTLQKILKENTFSDHKRQFFLLLCLF